MTLINRTDNIRSNSLPPNEDFLNTFCLNSTTSDIFLNQVNLENLDSKSSPSVSSSLATDDSGFGNHRDVSDLPSLSSGLSKDEFLIAMSEDLSEWLCKLYPDLCNGLNYENFFDVLSTGVIICHHAQVLQKTLANYKVEDLSKFKTSGTCIRLPKSQPTFSTRNISKDVGAISAGGLSSSALFVSRDNISNFISWAKDLGLGSCILFETEDLIGKKNLRNFIVCLMEIARIGGKFGLLIPEIIHLEAEIDGELLEDKSCTESLLKKPKHIATPEESKLRPEIEKKPSQPASSKYMDIFNKQSDGQIKPKPERPDFDLKSLDEIVRDVLSKCTCEKMFPMIRLSEGRYRFGNKSQIIFVRILRNHVMVRVGGGWDTLNDFLNKHDECRKHKSSPASEIKREMITEKLLKDGPYEDSSEVSPPRKSRSRSVTKSFALEKKSITHANNPSSVRNQEITSSYRRYSEVRKAPVPRFHRKTRESQGETSKIPLPTRISLPKKST